MPARELYYHRALIHVAVNSLQIPRYCCDAGLEAAHIASNHLLGEAISMRQPPQDRDDLCGPQIHPF